MDLKEELRRSFRPAVVVAVAVLASLAVYILLAVLLRAGRPLHRPLLRRDAAAVLRLVFYGLAILQVIIIRIMRGLFFRPAPGVDARALGRRLMLVSLFTSVFSEVPALLGFVLFLLAGLNWDLYVLVFVSLVLMFMFFPRLGYWEEWVEEQMALPPSSKE